MNLKNETYEKYFFDKVRLVRPCEINNKQAVSGTIDGLANATIQTGIKAGRYETPEALYSECLSTLPVEYEERKSGGSCNEFLASNYTSCIYG